MVLKGHCNLTDSIQPKQEKVSITVKTIWKKLEKVQEKEGAKKIAILRLSLRSPKTARITTDQVV